MVFRREDWDAGGAGAQNNIAGDWAGGSSQTSIYLRQRFSGNGSVILPGYFGGSADDAAVTTYLSGRNTVAAPSAGFTAVLVSHTGTTPYANGSCTTPP